MFMFLQEFMSTDDAGESSITGIEEAKEPYTVAYARVKQLLKVEQSGIAGAITGRAIYEGTLDLKEAQTLSDAAE